MLSNLFIHRLIVLLLLINVLLISPLSSTLFNIFMNESFANDGETGVKLGVKNGVKLGENHLSCLLFADDVVVFGETENGLQYLLDRALKWGNMWGIHFNIAKSRVTYTTDLNILIALDLYFH